MRVDGSTISVQGGREAEANRSIAARGGRKGRYEMRFVKAHPLCIAWVASCLAVGAWLSGWLY